VARWRGGHAIGVAILLIRRRGIAGGRLQDGRLVLVRIVGHGAGSGSLRRVWLGRRQMGMNVHVRLRVVHAAERGRAGIKAVGGSNGVLRIERKPTLS
jgi:hypothetical protein